MDSEKGFINRVIQVKIIKNTSNHKFNIGDLVTVIAWEKKNYKLKTEAIKGYLNMKSCWLCFEDFTTQLK